MPESDEAMLQGAEILVARVDGALAVLLQVVGQELERVGRVLDPADHAVRVDDQLGEDELLAGAEGHQLLPLENQATTSRCISTRRRVHSGQSERGTPSISRAVWTAC